MARRRMFSLDVVDTDKFLDMPASTQNLYFNLGMRADDDGFVANPRKITSLVNCSNDDLKLLIAKGYIYAFDSGVCAVKDWGVNNYVRPDRYTKTKHISELNQLKKDNGVYVLLENVGIPNDNQMSTTGIPDDIPLVVEMDPQVRLGKVRIGEVSLDKDNTKSKTNSNNESSFAKLTKKQIIEIIDEHDFPVELKHSIWDWIVYKKEKNQNYKPQGLKSLLSQINKAYLNYGYEAVDEVITFSMANNYQGITFDRLKNRQPVNSGDRLSWIDGVDI